jgi:hypothetical protein
MSTSSTQPPPNFTQALDAYRSNYVQYRTTGRAEFKIAYENAQAWIDTYLKQLDTAITTDAQSISKFVTEYSNANPELRSLQKQFSTIRKDGPRLQDAYTTVKRVNEEQPVLDNTDLYVKAGIAAGLLGIVLVMSA